MHELQGGIAIQRQHEESAALFANGGFAREEAVLVDALNLAEGVRPFWREVWDVTRQATGLGTSDDIAFYLQERWQPWTRLLISAGIRADFIRRVDDLFDVTVQQGVAVGPRLGVVHALPGERHTLRGSWTRVHDALSNNRAAGGASSAGKTDLFDFDLDGTFEAKLRTPSNTSMSRNRVFDSSRGQPFIDEWTAGYRAHLPAAVSLDVAFVHREYRNRTAAVEVNGIYEEGMFRGYRDETQNEIHQVTANRWNWLVYKGVEVQAAKRGSAIEATAGYPRAWRQIAGTWQPNDPAGFLQPDAFANNRGVGGVRSPVPMDATASRVRT